MKSLITKVIIVLLLVACFGGGVWQTVNYIEDRIMTTAVSLVENSEFIAEVRVMIQDVVEDVIHDLLIQGYNVVLEDGTVVSVTP